MLENLDRIKILCEALEGLQQDFVFVGGAVVQLYATNPELSEEFRPTEDVDILIELISYHEYSKLDERLRSLGFRNDTESGVFCRYFLQGIVVDVMPTDASAIGFSNRWYKEGFDNPIEYRIDETTVIKIFSLPYFFASKWEAFKGRGNNDYRSSKDFEDIVYILQNVNDFEQQIQNAPEHLRNYLKDEFKGIIYSNDFEEGVYANLPYNATDAKPIRTRLSTALGLT